MTKQFVVEDLDEACQLLKTLGVMGLVEDGTGSS